MSAAQHPPGWYPDPWYPGAVRWFDGVQWTEHAGMGGAGAPAEHYDGAKGASTARWAGYGFLARGGAAALQAVLGPLMIARVWDQLIDSFGDPQRTGVGPTGLVWVNVVSQSISLLAIGAMVLLLLWSHRATSNARQLGLTTTYGPGMAVGGWLIPFANFVLPFQIVRDLFPAGDPGRRLAGWWWACEMSGVALVFVALIVSVASGPHVGAGVPIGVCAAAFIVTSAALGYRLTSMVADRHASLASAAGLDPSSEGP